MYRVVDDEEVTAQLEAFPHEALVAYAELRTLLEIEPWSGESMVRENPGGGLRSIAFGAERAGLAVYIILEDQLRVDVVQVAWLG